MKIRTVGVLGGSGFVGRHLLERLAGGGRRITVLTRHRERHKALLLLPNLSLQEADVFDEALLQSRLAGCDAVINLVGILNENRPGQFQAVHADLPRRVADACVRAGVPRLLHMSALNAGPDAPSHYLRSKAAGELAVHAAAARGVAVTCFRPAVIFGPDDSFFNRFAALLALTPVLPLACPDARFAPVYVDDVARAFATALEDPATFGKSFDLCGPNAYTLKELVDYTARLTGRRRLVVGLSDGLSRLQARMFDRLPGRPFTWDNYQSLQVDSVCSSDGLAALGLPATAVEAVMPMLLGGSRHARYARFRRQGRRGRSLSPPGDG
ncbi:MAG: complex I NDUFA9 subunit family protein [Pseudomonadota bacterium]|nr:complex I NDUFA9 subunit family protein [Pseudomonadota bacterium]